MVIEGILAVMSGGLTGLVGSLITDVTDHFKQKAKQKNDVELKRLDIDLLKAETDASIQIAETERQMLELESKAKVDLAEVNAFVEAQKSDADVLASVSRAKKSSILLNIAAFTRTMIRPFLTVYLCVLSTFLYLDAKELIDARNESLTTAQLIQGSAQAYEVYSAVSDQVLYLTSASVLFWFGQRKKKK